jgi:hypothetical protein
MINCLYIQHARALPSDLKGTASLIRLTTPLFRSVQLARKEPTEVLRKNRLHYVKLAVADQTCIYDYQFTRHQSTGPASIVPFFLLF